MRPALSFLLALMFCGGCFAQKPDDGTDQMHFAAMYRHDGTALLNDLTVTPGAVDSSMTAARLCAKGFRTGSVRHVTEAQKRAVCAAYGVPKDKCDGRHYEIDHLVSLELGGSNDSKNLWPQPYAPKPGAKEKDTVENALHRQVCSGALKLADAQREISADWYAVYLSTQGHGGANTAASGTARPGKD